MIGARSVTLRRGPRVLFAEASVTLNKGDRIGITAGLPSGRPGSTSLFQVQTVREPR